MVGYGAFEAHDEPPEGFPQRCIARTRHHNIGICAKAARAGVLGGAASLQHDLPRRRWREVVVHDVPVRLYHIERG